MKNILLKSALVLVIAGLTIQIVFIVLDVTHQYKAEESFRKSLKNDASWIF